MKRIQTGIVFDDLADKLKDVDLSAPADGIDITLSAKEIMLLRKILSAYSTVWELAVEINDHLAAPFAYFTGRVEAVSALGTAHSEMKYNTSNARGRAERIRDIIWENLNFGE